MSSSISYGGADEDERDARISGWPGQAGSVADAGAGKTDNAHTGENCRYARSHGPHADWQAQDKRSHQVISGSWLPSV